jgi:hypothetical protein
MLLKVGDVLEFQITELDPLPVVSTKVFLRDLFCRQSLIPFFRKGKLFRFHQKQKIFLSISFHPIQTDAKMSRKHHFFTMSLKKEITRKKMRTKRRE